MEFVPSKNHACGPGSDVNKADSLVSINFFCSRVGISGHISAMPSRGGVSIGTQGSSETSGVRHYDSPAAFARRRSERTVKSHAAVHESSGGTRRRRPTPIVAAS
jgi:hypothetical protein